ncbi:MAG: DUF748 domain-containing protein [Cyclobacteriaceae bacterium]|nr:DUF748 domain-containing protein [Cyclobacteriaceae bacterium]
MRKRQTRKLYISIAGIAVGVAFATSLLIEEMLERKIATELSKGGSVASVQVNILTRSVHLHQWVIDSKIIPLQGSIERLELSGISLYQILAGKTFRVKNILIDRGFVSYDFSKKTDSVNQKKDLFPIQAENVTLNEVHFSLRKDSVFTLLATANVTFGAVWYDKPSSLTTLGTGFQHLTGSFNKLTFLEATGFYKILVDKIVFNSEARSLLMDSLKIIPTYGQVEFALAKGEQVTRIDLSVPHIIFSQIDYNSLFDSILIVSRLSLVESTLHAFRDKRVPFTKKEVVPMPMHSLAKLPFKIKIDSIDIQRTTIRVEEIAENAQTSGHVVFSNVNGLLTNLNSYESNPALLSATGTFMKTGLIEATFTFPLDTTQEYTAKGKISKVPFKEINSMTAPAASLQFESGLLNSLYFNFSYNDYKSLGEIQLNYKDLKLVSMSKEKNVQVVKSALINALLKDTKDKSVPIKDRKGKIEFDRDRRRSIFNLWWKSLQAGLRDTILGSQK